MPLPPQLDIYKASAGSGKTFLLALQYLKLVLQHPANYRHVLAVTFTNKATAEMKERILTELKNLAAGTQTVYADKLLEAMPESSFPQLQERAVAVYSAILHDYSRFAVTTIDSFVQRIIRSFAFEIGLDAGFKLKLNTAVVKEDLADRLFRLLDFDSGLRNWVAELALRRLSEGKNWNFRTDMLELAEEMFGEPFQNFETALAGLPDVQAAFRSLRDKVFAFTTNYEQKWQEAGEKAVQLLADHLLSESDFHYGKSGFINYFFKAAKGTIEKPGSRVIEILENPGKMGGKKPHPVIALIQQDLHRLLHELCSHCDRDFETYNTALALSHNIGNLRLMRVFSEQLGQYRSEENVLLISDIHLLLRQLTKDTEANFIYEKTGNRFRHFLIDEFQDTSSFQWDNFKPLLENSLGEGNYNLIVGDVKQAIYRWRSGDWQLLQQKVGAQLKHLSVATHSLQENRRSARPVISFNNFLFHTAPRLLQEELNSYIGKAPENVRDRLVREGFDEIMVKAYAESRQKIPDTSPGNGLVDISFLRPGEDSYDEVVLPLLFERISGLLQSGFAAKDIAILTRNNYEATRIIEYLIGAQQAPSAVQFSMLSADALLLAKNNTVCILIKAMEVLAGDGGRLALAHLRHALVLHLDLKVTDHQVFISKQEDDVILPKAFYRKRAALHRLPLAELVSSLITLFNLNRHAADAAYLLAFQDLIGEWSRFENDGLQSFLRYWENEGKQTSLPGGVNTNAIEVLTIHKSKGLDFTIVLLPYLTWEIKPDSRKSVQLWVETGHTPFNDVPVVPVRYSSSLTQSAFAYSYFEELLLGMMDNLNLLYVAATRARRQIIGWAPWPEKVDNPGTMEKLLYSAATRPVVLDPEFVRHVPGNEESPDVTDISLVQQGFDDEEGRWIFGSDTVPPQPGIPAPAPPLPPLQQSAWKDRLTVRYKPMLTEQEFEARLPRELGILLHEAMALLKRPDYLDRVTRHMAQQGLITLTQQAQLREKLEAVLAMPVMHDWVIGRMHRLSEREILSGKEELKRPDLVFYNNEKTTVIDFKFSDDRSAHQRYSQQVKGYVSLLEQTGFSNISAFLLYAGDEPEAVAV